MSFCSTQFQCKIFTVHQNQHFHWKIALQKQWLTCGKVDENRQKWHPWRVLNKYSKIGTKITKLSLKTPILATYNLFIFVILLLCALSLIHGKKGTCRIKQKWSSHWRSARSACGFGFPRKLRRRNSIERPKCIGWLSCRARQVVPPRIKQMPA